MDKPADNTIKQDSSTPNSFNRNNLLKVSQAAEFLGTSPSTLRRYESEGKISSERLENNYRVYRLDMLKNLKEEIEREKIEKENKKREQAAKKANYAKSRVEKAIKTEIKTTAVEAEHIVNKLDRFNNVLKRVPVLTALIIGMFISSKIDFVGNFNKLKNAGENAVLSTNSNVLAARNRVTDFVYKINIPTIINNDLTVEQDLSVAQTTETSTLTFTDEATMNNLLDIDETTEDTLERLIDIDGDVVGTGLNDVKLAATGVDADTYGSTTEIPVIEIGEDGRIIDASTESVTIPNTTTASNGLTKTGDNIALGGALTQDTRIYDSSNEFLYFDVTSGYIGVGTTSPSTAFEVNGRITTEGINIPTGAQTGYVLTSDNQGNAYWAGISGAGGGGWVYTNFNLYPNDTQFNVAIGSSDPGDAKLYVNGDVGIGTTSPQYALEVSGAIGSTSVLTTNLYLGGTEITANAAEINILSGATLSTSELNTLNGILATTAELNMLSGRTGILVDTNNIPSYATTAVTAGNGLIGGGGAGNLSLSIGAGSGITVNTNSIEVDVSTTSTTPTTSSNSGLEATTSGLRLLGGCSDNEVLLWDSTTSTWQCTSAGTGTVTGTASAAGQIAFWDSSTSIDGTDNLYWDNATSRLGIGNTSPSYAVDVNGDINYTGTLRYQGNQISTTQINEGTNLYFTNERVDDRVNSLIQDGTGLTWTYVDGSDTLTGNVSLSPFSTTDLSEGTNQYFTNARARAAVSASAPLQYNSGTGEFSITQSGAGTDGYLSSTDWNTFNNKLTSTLTNANIFVGNSSNVATSVSMTGDATLSNTGVLTLSNTGVSANTYGSTTEVPVIAVDTQGRITSASNVTISASGIGAESPLTFSNGLTRTGDSIKLGGTITEDTRIYDGTYEYVMLDAGDGNIGLGTTDPSYKLDVSGTGRFTGALTLDTVTSVANNNQVLTVDSGVIKYIDSSSWDTNASNDLLTTTVFGGDVSGVYSNIQIGSGVINELELNVTNSATDNYVLTYDNSSTGFTWVDPDDLGTNYWQKAGTVLSPATAGDSISSSSVATTDLFLSGTEILATATEINLLSGRTGTLIDTNNVSTYATTGVTAGSGLTGGGTTGALTLNIGAGNGVTVNADNITIDATTTGTTSITSSNSGLEVTTGGLRIVGGCSDNEVLAWDNSTSTWTCTNASGIGGVTGSGLDNYLARWDGTDDLQDSSVYVEDGGDVGIGTTNPSDTLHVAGNILTTSGLHIGSDTEGSLIDDASNGSASNTLYIGNESILVSGDIGASVQGYDANTSLLGQTIEETELLVTNSATDNYVLTYDNSSGGFTWVAPGGVGTNYWDRTGTVLSPATAGDSISSSSVATTDLFLSGTEILATATEINLLSGRSGVLVDSNNVDTYATTAVTSGSGLTGGGTTGALTLNIGAGNGISVAADSISIDATTTGTTSVTSSNSGLEVTSGGLRMLGGCSDNEVLAWDSSTSTWTCTSTSGIGGITGSGTDNYLARWDGTGALQNSSVYIKDSGYVGVGTSDPKTTMHLVSGSGGQPALRFDNTYDSGDAWTISSDTDDKLVFSNGSWGELIRLYVNGATFNDMGYASYDFKIEGDTDTALFFADAGSDLVGIGTTSPAYKLDVNGTSRFTGNLTLDSVASVANNNQVLTVDSGVVKYIDSSNWDFDDTDDLVDSDIGVTVQGYNANTSLLGQTIETSEITDDTILEADLDITNSATDNYVLTYDNSSAGFTWVDPDTVGTNYWTRAGTVLSPATAGDSISSSSVATTDLFLGGTEITSTADELNILDGVLADAGEINILNGATLNTTELNLLDGRSGVLVDSNNVTTYATTGVTAGSGLTGGGTTGALTLNIGAGNGISVAADSVTIDATTTGTTSVTSSNSGLEVTSGGLRMLGGCSDNEVLAWDSSTSAWTCTSTSGIGGVTGSGTDNYLARWNGTGALQDSSIYETSGQIGIGTTAPSAAFEVANTARFTGAVQEAAQSTDRIDIGVENGTPRMVFEDNGNTIWEIDNSGGTFRWYTPGTERLTLDSSGNVNLSTGGLQVGGTSVLTSGRALQNLTGITSGGTITFSGLSTGTDNSVIVLNASNQLVTDEIDSRVWGSTLLDDTDIGSTVQEYNANTSLLGQTIETGEITDDTILEADLDITNSATDNYVLTYDNSSAGFTWVDPDDLGTNYWSRAGTVLSPATAGDSITSSSVATTDLFLGGTEILATASELNILSGATLSTSELNVLDGISASTAELNILDGVLADASELNILNGATLNTTELNLLDGRSGVLVDSNNVTTYATTAVTAGSGLTGGGTTGALTLNIGAGNGISVAADSVTIDATTTGTTSVTSSNSGLEVTSGGLRMLGGCSDNEVLAWDSATSAWTCTSTSGIGGITGSGTDNYLARWNGTGALQDSSLYVKDTGEVGIGTTNPTQTLEVNGNILAARLQSSYGTAAAPSFNFADSNGMYRPATNTIGFSINGTERMRISNTGYLGIGTTSPQANLHVNGTSGLIVTNIGNNWQIKQDSGAVSTFYGTTSDSDQFAQVGAYDNVFNFQGNSRNLRFRSDSISSIMEVEHDTGDVGIGTTNPTDKLHVVGSILGTAGFHVGTDADGSLIDDASTGSASNTLYIGNESILVSGDIGSSVQAYNANTSLLGQTIETGEITNGTILEADLNVTSAPTDNYVLTYDNSSTGFTWVDPAGLGTNYWSRTGTVLSPATSGDDIVTTGQIGIGTTSPSYALDVVGAISGDSVLTTDLFIGGSEVTATSAELNILDGVLTDAGEINILNGATLNTTELNLLDGRSGVLVDSNNVTTYATTGVTAGSGLTGGGTTGALTLNIGAGNGISVAADSVTIDATTTGTTSVTSSNSGLEVTTGGLRMLGGCSDNEVLAWDSATSAWTCTSTSGIGGVTGSGTDNYLARWDGTGALQDSSLYVKDTGEVGIGTTNPESKLQVNGIIRSVQPIGGSDYMFQINAEHASGPRLQLGTLTNEDAYFEIGSWGSINNFDSKNRDLHLYTTGETGIYLKDGGYVGIGTTNPTYTLDVSGTGRFTGNLTLDSVASVANNNQMLTVDSGVVKYISTSSWDTDASNDLLTTDIGVTVQGYSANTSLLGQTIETSEITDRTILEADLNVTSAPTDNYVLTYDNSSTGFTWVDPDDLGTNYWDRTGTLLSPATPGDDIYASGNIGIGTTAPLGKLHVTNSNSGNITTGIYLKNNTTVNGGIAIDFDNTTSDNVQARINSIRTNNSDFSTALAFHTNTTGGTLTERLRIDTEGNIGIGTTNPGYALDVVGAISGNSVLTTNLFLGGTEITATGTEINLLDGRSGTLVDSNNVTTYATTGVTAGSGLTGGGTTGALTLNIGAGNGITVAADSITVDTTTTGTTSVTSSNSGLETTSAGVRMLGGCSDAQVLIWDNSSSTWTCSDVSGGSGAIGGTGAANRVAFWTGSSNLSNDDNFYWNNSTKKLGIGTTAPSSRLTITPADAAGLQINPYGSSSGNTGEFRLTELTANGSNYTGFKAPDSLGANLMYTLPSDSAASADYVLTWQSGNVMEWKEATGVGGTGDITQVGSMQSGATFSSTAADEQWLGLGASAGRIQFFDETTDFVTINDANVGIGTTAPSYKLDVAGTARFSDILGNNTGQKIGFSRASGYIDLLPSGSGNMVSISNQNMFGTGDLFLQFQPTGDNSVFESYDKPFYVATGGGTHPVYFAPNRTIAMTIAGDGEVGIGTTNPRTRLHITGSGTDDSSIPALGNSDKSTSLMVSNDDGDYGLLFGSLSNGKGWIQAQRADTTATSYDLLLQPNGSNVGIGTTAPSAKLEISGGNVLLSNNQQYQIKNSGGTARNVATINSANDTYFGDTASNHVYLTAGADKNIYFRDNATTNMTILGSGYVGIGNTAPQTSLTIGNINSGTGEATYMGTVQIQTNGGRTNSAGGLEFKMASSGNGYGWRITNPDLGTGEVPMYFQSRINSTSWTDKISILGSSGYVGIGTTNPTDTLHVAGNVLATGGLHIGTDTDGSLIDDASTGSSSTTLYIGNESILASGDIDNTVQGYDANTSLLGQTIETSEISDDTILEADLDITNSATDNYVLTYDNSSTGFTWVDPDDLGTNYWDRTGTLLQPATSGDDIYTSGNISIGTTDPDTTLHIVTGTETTIPAPDGSTIATFERAATGASSATLQIVSGSSGSGIINFGDTDVRNSGQIQYNHAINQLTLYSSTSTNFSYGNVGIGTTNPSYKLDVAGAISGTSVLTTDLFLGGTEITATGTEINLLDGRSGVLVDSNNVTTYATTGVTAGNGLTDGGTTGVLTLNVGAGNGISVAADSVTIDATTTGTTSVTSSNSGLEVTSGGLRMLGGCSDNEVLAWDSSSSTWTCTTTSGIGGITGSGTDNYLARWDGTGALQDSNLYVTDGGNVGIGTTNPGSQLHIVSSANDILELTNPIGTYSLNAYTWTAPSSYLIKATNSGYLQLESGTSNSIRLATNGGTEQMRITSSGDVGIGTTNPSYKLDVAGTGRFTGNLTLDSVASVANNNQVLTVDSGVVKYIDSSNWDFDDTDDLVDSDIGVTVQGYNANTSLLGQTIETGEITDDTILEADLDITNSATDNYVLTYDNSSTGFTWVDPSGLGTNYWDRTGTQLSPATAGDDIYTSGSMGVGISPSSGIRLKVYNAETDPSSNTTATYSETRITATSAPVSTQNTALNSTIYLQGTNNFTGANIGYASSAYQNGTGTVSYLEGLRGSVGTLTSGSVTNAYGVRGYVYSPGSGPITNLYGINSDYYASTVTGSMFGINIASNTGSAGTNKYGVRVQDVSGASSGNYAIYTGTGDVRFGDDVTTTASLTATSILTTDLFLGGTEITATGTEINLLDGRSGVLVDSNNVTTYATTGVTAGTGLTGGGTTGALTLNIGAGNGISVAADSVTIDATTTGTTSITSSNSGLEVTSGGLRMLGGCSDNEVLAWDSATSAWTCTSTSGIGGVTGSGTDNYLARWDGTGALQDSSLYVEDGGDVGIGTTNPGAKLDVNGNFRIQSGGTNYGFIGNSNSWSGDGSSNFIIASYRPSLSFAINGAATPKMLINSSGNVGIGTTDPDVFKLQVAGDVGPETDNTYDLGTASYRWRSLRAVTGYLNNTFSNNVYGSTSASGNLTIEGTNNATKGNIFMNPSGGYVGIGTTNPNSKLTVGGFNDGDGLNIFSPANNILAIQTTLDGQPLGTYGGNSNMLVLQPNIGYVGIGTTNPTDTLHVVGNILATGGLHIGTDTDGSLIDDASNGSSSTTLYIGDASILVSDDIGSSIQSYNADTSLLGQTIETGEITDDTILEADLDITNSATDNYVLTYDNSSTGFTWVDPDDLGTNYWDRTGTLLTPSTDTDNIATYGNIGIGTTDPQFTLDITTTQLNAFRISSSAANGTRFYVDNSAGNNSYISLAQGESTKWAIGSITGDNMFAIADFADFSDIKFSIDRSNGFVGIGTTDPSYKLELASGDISIDQNYKLYLDAGAGNPTYISYIGAPTGHIEFNVDSPNPTMSIKNGSVGIGTTNPSYNLDVTGAISGTSVLTTDLFLGGTEITATGTEINLLDGRSGVLVDSNNVTTYATTGVTAGSGLTGGGTTGALTLNIGAGNGISVAADSVTIDATTTGTTSVTSSNSGLEVTAGGLRMLGGCSDGQSLTWDSGTSTWTCTTASSGLGGSGTDNYIARWNGTGSLQDSPIYVKDTGEIGVGTTNPQHALELLESGYDARILIDTPNTTSNPGLEFRHNGEDNYRALIRSDYVSGGGANLSFWYSDGTVKHAMTIEDGDVGIGTSNPTAALHIVDGSYTAKIDNSGLGTGTNFYGNAATYFGTASENSSIIFRQGTNEAIRIENTTGDIGIGTTNPSAKLHINQSVETQFGGLAISSSGGASGRIFMNGSSDMVLQRYDQTDQLVLDNDGNVGIGTTDPTDALHVVGSVLGTAGFHVGTDSDGSLIDDASNGSSTTTLYIGDASILVSDDIGSSIQSYNADTSLLGQTIETGEITDDTILEADLDITNSATNGYVLTYDNSSSGFTWTAPGSVGLNYWTRTGITLSPETAGDNIVTTGSVGIGTTSPTSKFHVQWADSGCGGQCYSDAAIFENTGNTYLQLIGGASNERSINFGDASNGADGAIKFNEPAVADGFQFATGGNNTRMVIESAGDVGIGTTNPAYTLEVNGDTLAGDVYLNNADIGISSDDDLMSLANGALTINGTLTTTSAITAPTSTNTINGIVINSGEITSGTWSGTEISVTKGGTGTTSLTDHSVLVGSGTGAVTPISVGTNGQLLLGVTSSDPQFATMSGDATIANDGTLTLDTTGVSADTYGSATSIPQFQVDTKGRIVSASNIDISSIFESPLTFSNGLTRTGDTIKLGGEITENTRIYSASQEIMYSNSSNGYVGLGTTNPQERLHVQGNIDVPYEFRMNTYQSNFTTTELPFLRKSYVSGTYGDYLYLGSTGNSDNNYHSALMLGTTTGSLGGISFGTGHNNADQLTTTWAYLSTDGELGIGTTDPTAYLDLAAGTTSRASLRLQTGSAPSAPNVGDIYSNGSEVYFYNGSWIDLSSGGTATSLQTAYNTGNTIELSASEGDIRFYNDASTEMLFLDEDTGRIGMGNTSPSYTLDVTGSISGSSVLTTNLFIGGTQVTSTAAELNFLDGTTVVNGGIMFGDGAKITQDPSDFFWDSSNNRLGIGTSTPTSALSVGGSTSSISNDNGDFTITAAADLILQSTSYVGIGTTNPLAYLDIQGATTAAASMRIQAGSAPSAPASGDIYSDGDGLFYYTSGSWVDLSSGGTSVSLQSAYEDGNTIQLSATEGDLRMYNDASAEMLFLDEDTGYVGIGTTGPSSQLDVAGEIRGTRFAFQDDSDTFIDTIGTNEIGFVTNNTYQMALDSNGYLGVGTTGPAAVLDITKSMSTADELIAGNLTFSGSSGTAVGLDLNITDSTTSTAGYKGLDMYLSGSGSGTGSKYGLFVDTDSNFSGSLLYLAANSNSVFEVTTTKATFDVPVAMNSTGDISVANDLNFTNTTASYITSDAPLYIQSGNAGESESLYLASAGSGQVYVNDALTVTESGGVVGTFNRQTSDGTVISIQQDGAEEGTISVSSNTVSYNAFTGSHYAWTEQTLSTGTLVSLTGDNRRLHNDETSEILYGISASTTKNDSRVMGAYLTLLEPTHAANEDNPHLVMAVGNGEIWVANTGENIEAGDFLISSDVEGHAQIDDEDGTFSYVVARVAEDIDWENVEETVEINGEEIKHTKVSVFFESFIKNNSINQLSELNSEENILAQISTALDEFKSFTSSLGFTPVEGEEGRVDIEIADNLTVNGETTLRDTTITGNLTAGLIKIDTVESSINVLGASCYNSETDTMNGTLCESQTLFIQSESAGNLDIFNGKMVFEPNGNLKVEGTITAEQFAVDTSNEESASAGKVTITAGEDTIEIETTALDENSIILVTPERPVAIGSKKTDDDKFEITLKDVEDEDLDVNWLIVGTE